MVIGIVLILLSAPVGGQGGALAHTIGETIGEQAIEFFVHTAIVAGGYITVWWFMDMYDHLIDFIKCNPDVTNPIIKNIIGFFIRLIQPFYVLAITVTGAYMIFVSGSSKSRTKAKSILLRLIVGMVVVTMSIFWLNLLFRISEALTNWVLGLADYTMIINEFKNGIWQVLELFRWLTLFTPFLGVPVLIFGLVLEFAPFFMLAFRYMMVILWAMLFPLTIFFYSFSFTKGMGKAMINQTITWTFSQAMFAFALIALSIGMGCLTSSVPELPVFYIQLASLLMLTAAPMMMFGVMDWLTAGILMFAAVSTAETLVTGTHVMDESRIEREQVEKKEKTIHAPRIDMYGKGK